MVLGVYYAKARMYDAGDRRFMATDPVRGNVTDPKTMIPYVYVVNNPIRFIDPTGEYYIVQNGTVKVLSYKVAGYNDPSGLDYGDIYDVVTEFVPDGTYSIYKETNWLLQAKYVIKVFVPFGDFVNLYIENSIGVVSGTSMSDLLEIITSSAYDKVRDDSIDLAIKLVEKYGKDKLISLLGKEAFELLLKAPSALISLSDYVKSLEEYDAEVLRNKSENIAIDFLVASGFSLTSDSKDSLEELMSKALALIVSNSAYFMPAQGKGTCSIFELDQQIIRANSDEQAKQIIDKIVNSQLSYITESYSIQYYVDTPIYQGPVTGKISDLSGKLKEVAINEIRNGLYEFFSQTFAQERLNLMKNELTK